MPEEIDRHVAALRTLGQEAEDLAPGVRERTFSERTARDGEGAAILTFVDCHIDFALEDGELPSEAEVGEMEAKLQHLKENPDSAGKQGEVLEERRCREDDGAV
mgnify:FL=1